MAIGALAAAAGARIAAPAAGGGAIGAPDASPLYGRFESLPLPAPLVLTGTFGEHRNSHVHAGLDLSTGMVVGLPVTAPISGWIERVRAQGVGYGRSIYLHARDGRLVVFGHLDAFDEPLASYVAAAQDSSGQYDQDLWPEAHRFEVRAGQRLGWSGRSGTGDPHLHLEVRRVDMALNPLRAGVHIPDRVAPVVQAVTLEPLDESSWVNRTALPRTVTFGARAETLVVEGAVRAIVRAVDPGERRANMAPWSVGIEWDGRATEVRFDSVSWATDLPDLDYLYDRGRGAAFAKTTVQPWGSAGVRPRPLHASVPESEDAGRIEVRAGDPPRALRVRARDLAGNAAERVVWLRGPKAGERGGRAPLAGAKVESFDPLPHGRLRVELAGAAGVRDAVVLPPGEAAARVLDSDWTTAPVGPGGEGFSADPRAPFDPGARWAYRREERASDVPPELAQRSPVLALLPARLPLRAPAAIALAPAAGAPPDPRVALYRQGDEGWEYLGAARDTATGAITGTSRRIGRFALFADTLAPRIRAHGAPARRTAGAYSTWALAAPLAEDGSGVDARATYFEVDGRRVPSEWDAVRNILRWRPLRAPASGAHRYVVVARDRAGNERRAAGRFVLD